MKSENKIKLKMFTSPKQSIGSLPTTFKSTLKPLSVSIQDPSFFKYEDYSSLPSPYPQTRFKLSHTQLKKWFAKRGEDNEEEELSDHDVNVDDEEPTFQTEPLSPKSPKMSTPARVGPKAVADFFSKYKGLNKITSPANEKKPSATFRYLKTLEKLHYVPHPMGIVKWKGLPNELNLQSYKMGDTYAAALSKGMGYMNPEFVNLADNRLTNIGSHAIISHLKPSVKYLNVSQNKIDGEGATALGEFLKYKGNSLRGLNLENTKLGDNATILLCKQLIDHPRLKDLNLAKNHITDLSCEAISQLVYDTFYLTSLILHWNLITGEGASKILKATIRYSNIKVIDFSWNSIGTFKGKLFANQLAEILTTQENFVHLDVSHNKIRPDDCRTIACALAANHTLWGFHFVGNSTYSIDSKGFLNEGLLNPSVGIEHLETRVNGARMVVANLDRVGTKLKRTHNCWICEGWNEVTFEYPQNKPNEPVYLNLECDDYKGDLMCTEPGMVGYFQWRMCPPGRTKFFFTTEGKAVVSPKYPIMKYHLNARIKLDDDLYPYVDVVLKEINYLDVKPNPNIVRESYEITIQNCVPRPIPGYHHRPKAKKARAPWSIPISLFKDYIVDTETLWGKCFEEDWKRMVKPRMKEEILSKCKEILRKNYGIIMYNRKETYKYYAAIGRTENLFAINKLTLTDFIAHKIFLCDGDKLTDMDLTFSAVKGRPKVAKFQPRTALVRFEFLELLFRLAIKRYFDSKEVNSEPAAVEKLLIQNIVPNCSQFNCQAFRDTRYWNEECDNILKSHIVLFDSLYDNNSGSRRLPGEKNFMCYDEFMGIMTSAGLITDEFPERDAMAAFALSMMTQVDEFDNDRHMKMQKVEFYEAIARAAEGVSLAPPNSNPEEWPLDKRQAQTLAEKMDNIIPALLSVAKKEVRERFKKPEKDKSTGLYLVPVDSPTKAVNSFFSRL